MPVAAVAAEPEEKASGEDEVDVEAIDQPAGDELEAAVGPEKSGEEHAELDGRDAELVLEHGGGDGEIAAVEVIEEGGEGEKNDDEPERDGETVGAGFRGSGHGALGTFVYGGRGNCKWF